LIIDLYEIGYQQSRSGLQSKLYRFANEWTRRHK